MTDAGSHPWERTDANILPVRPEPRRTPDAAGVAVPRAHESCRDRVGKNEWAPQARHLDVQLRHIRHAPTKDDHVRIEHVDDAGKGARHPARIPAQSISRCLIATGRILRDGCWSERMSHVPLVVRLQARTREKGLD